MRGWEGANYLSSLHQYIKTEGGKGNYDKEDIEGESKRWENGAQGSACCKGGVSDLRKCISRSP